MSALLSVRDLTIAFQTEDGLAGGVRDISFTVERGEIVALVGESGSGKSITSLSILQLLPSPPARYLSGEILFTCSSGQQIDLLQEEAKSMQRVRGNEIAMIFQEPMTSLNPVYTCGHQVTEAIRAHDRVTAEQARQRALTLFEKVKLPDPAALFSRYPHQLSGGQKQRVMIAMAMSCRPSLLICDEPTTALDVTVQKTILELIRELQQTENMGVIFITHDLGVVAEIADRALVLYKGGIVEQGGVRELFANPRHPYTKGLLNCRPVLHHKGERLPVVSDFMEVEADGTIREKQPGPVLSGGGGEEVAARQGVVEEVVGPTQEAREKGQDAAVKEPISGLEAKGGRKLDRERAFAGERERQEVLVSVQELCVWYPGRKALFGKTRTYTRAVDNVSFDIYRGETLGLVGESGCGKTTLGRTLLRLIEPTAGQILFEGRNLGSFDGKELTKMRSHIQIIFQDPYSALNPRLTIGSAIAEAMQVHGIGATGKQRRAMVEELLEKVSLKADHFDRYPHEFSGGQRQRIVIARALALRPSFIVCDESVSALDVSVQAQVLNLLNDLKKEFRFTAVFISHDLSVVRYISDRILVMNKGKIEEIGEAESVYNHPSGTYTKQLIAAIPQGEYTKR